MLQSELREKYFFGGNWKVSKSYKICNGSEAKSAFILANVSETPISDGKKRKYARNYHLGVNRVCLKFFCQVLEVTKNVVVVVMEKERSGSLKDQPE